MKIGIVWENGVSKWSMQMFEPLIDMPDVDINVFVGERNKYDVSQIMLNKIFLSHKEEVTCGLRSLPDSLRRAMKNPYKRMDFYYNSLNRHIENYDIIECPDSSRSLYSLADLKKKKGVKLIVSYAENIPYRQVFDGKTNYIKHYSFESIDHFIPWCDTIKRVLILEGVSEEKITTVYAGIDINMFKPEPKDADMLKEFELSEDNFIISYVGKLVSWKGIHNLAYAAKALLQNGYKKFCFLITGNGAQLENLKKIITEAGIGKHFRFTGFVPYGGMGKIHNLADVFVLTSYPTMTWQEQFGMVLIEAMACNKPVIATTTGSIPEIVGDAGVVVPPGDFFQLAQEIAKFIDNRELIQIKGENARQRVEAHFDARKNALKLYNIYKKVLQC